MAGFRLIPTEEKFYSDFLQMADLLVEAGRALEEMLSVEPPLYDKATEIRDLEEKCDFWTHEIFQRLNRTFVTPMDREDIHELAGALDEVMDAMDDAANLFTLYRTATLRPGVREILALLTAQTREIRLALQELETRKGVLERSIEINRLEHEADDIHRRLIGALFDEEKDPIMIIKWKDILTYLERATDRAEDVANLLESIVVKHG
jgi:predicted phosphate transport protein (TIGR00153 family)